MNNKFVSALVSIVMLAAPVSASASCNDGKDRNVRVINDTSFTILNLYGSNVGSNDWEEDVLGSQVIAPGATFTVNFDDGSCYCNFDLKAVFNDRTETIRNRFNVCTESSWRIHE
jgi:hypothetical protein